MDTEQEAEFAIFRGKVLGIIREWDRRMMEDGLNLIHQSYEDAISNRLDEILDLLFLHAGEA